jgi:hypothetical protein
MLSSNRRQSERIQIIFQALICHNSEIWKLSHIEYTPHPTIEGDCESITIYFVDKSGVGIYYIIDHNGNYERRQFNAN